jgi:hypothetical protein
MSDLPTKVYFDGVGSLSKVLGTADDYYGDYISSAVFDPPRQLYTIADTNSKKYPKQDIWEIVGKSAMQIIDEGWKFLF